MKIIQVFVLILAATLAAQAQKGPDLYTLDSPYKRYTHNLATFRWSAALPMGSLSDGYIDKASAANYSLSLEWVLRNSPFSIGGEVGKLYFQQRLPRAIYQFDEEDVSAIQTRTYSNVPVQGFVNYHLTPVDARIRPYVQLGAGAHFNNYINYYGTLADQKKQITFGLSGGVGSRFLFKKDGSIGLDLAVRYGQNFFKYEYITNGTANLSASAGLFYRWW